MTAIRDSAMSVDELIIWVIHRFSEVFQEHVILKGGMQLMLLSSERATNDLDYVFVPFDSKKEIAPRIEELLGELPDARVEMSLHSTSGRLLLAQGDASIQIEFNVASHVPSDSLTTELLAKKVNRLPQVIRVMKNEVAMAHKLAAWNERRLARDLYDIYFWYAQMGVLPDREVLKIRLSRVVSRLPKLKMGSMSLGEFWSGLESEVGDLDQAGFYGQLRPLFPTRRLEGLLPVLKSKLSELAIWGLASCKS